jgi:hypothetical protein
MDGPIIKRETIQKLGAEAYDKGRGIDDHGMNPGSAAIADWRLGWIERRAEVRAQEAQATAEMVLALAIAMECPP